MRNELTLESGVQSSPIEIVLRDDGAMVSGRVDVGKGLRPTAVALVPDSGPAIQTKTVTVSDNGEFIVEGLPPGDYYIFAFDLMDGLEYTEPEVVNQFVARATHVTLQPNEKHTIPVELRKVGN